MNHHRTLAVLAAAMLLACRAGGAPQAPAAEKPAPAATRNRRPPPPRPGDAGRPARAAPKSADPRTEALLGWLDGYFPWGAGELTIDALDAVGIPGWRLYRASKAFAGDKRANDQAFVLADDTGKTALVGDVFVDEARLKAPKPVRGEADIETLRELLSRFLRGRFKVAFEPSLDRRSFKGLKIQHETGYGAYDISGLRLLRGRRPPPRRPGLGPGQEPRGAAARPDPARRRSLPGPGGRRGHHRRVLRHAVPVLQEAGGRPRRPRRASSPRS